MMRSLVFFIFFCNLFVAQTQIKESNRLVYDKDKLGMDLQTFPGNAFQFNNGQLIVKSYTQPLASINSTGAQIIDNKKIVTDPILSYIKLGSSIYLFCEWGSIFKLDVTKKITKLLKFPGKIAFFSIESNQKYIYFVTKNLESNVYDFYVFNGLKYKLLKRSKNELIVIQDRLKNIFLLEKKKSTKSYATYQMHNELLQQSPHQLKISSSRIFKCNSITDLVYLDSIQKNIIRIKNNKKHILYTIPEGFTLRISGYSPNLDYYPLYKNKTTKIIQITSTKVIEIDGIEDVSAAGCILKNTSSESYYLATAEKLYRTFPLIKKYPKIFNTKNSNQIYAINQASDGTIWINSYDGFLNFITKDKIVESGLKDYVFFHGGLRIGNTMIINTENKGVLLFDKDKKIKTIHPTAIGLSNLLSKDSVLYIATADKNIIYTHWKNVVKGNAVWKSFTKENGNSLNANISLIEDKFGNIWSGRSKEGICVFQPYLQKGKTWLLDKKQIDFGSASQVLDYRKNLWFGTKDGDLYFYDGKHRDDLSSSNFKKIKHPLLGTGKKVSFLKSWNQHIIIGQTDKVLIFDAKEWYENKKVLIRYLHPYETNFTSYTEQNTIVKDFRDTSIWFATNDMLYQWDFQKWINLPKYNVIPKLIVKIDSVEKRYIEKNNFSLGPQENTFELVIDYQTLDNLPRLINAQLVKEGEKPKFNEPNFNHKFSFYNLSSGNYVFYVRICQQNGEETLHKFIFKIEKHIWEYWWFWFLLSLIPLTFFYFYFKKSRELELQKKRIAQLNVATISNQFRPHFMLNALNSLGADLDDKPHAESVISRIGENISLMYDYTQANKFYFEFEREWQLVLNTIEIQKLMFLKNLSFEFTHIELIPKNYLLPMGLLQVCVENALIHGIRHRKEGPWKLQINFKQEFEYYIVEIIDNGVGMEKSKLINSFASKGTGLKNLFSLLEIINAKFENAITLHFEKNEFDNIYYPGTKVILKLKTIIDYESFKL